MGIPDGDTAITFEWSGGNDRSSRTAAARELLRIIKNHKFKKGETLNIVTHSHGGNVALDYSELFEAVPIDRLLTLSLPSRSDYSGRRSNINSWVQVALDEDSVIPRAGAQGDTWFGLKPSGILWNALLTFFALPPSANGAALDADLLITKSAFPGRSDFYLDFATTNVFYWLYASAMFGSDVHSYPVQKEYYLAFLSSDIKDAFKKLNALRSKVKSKGELPKGAALPSLLLPNSGIAGSHDGVIK
ncbi:MAG: hypothetical protein AB7F75_07020 [Planctomycetota bacterium]